MVGTPAKVVTVDLRRMTGFINSVAYAQAAAIFTSIKIDTFSPNAIMNAIAQATTGQPGIADVEEDSKAIEAYQKRKSRELLTAALAKAAESPAAFQAYMRYLDADRQRNLVNLQNTYRSASQIDERNDISLSKTIDVLAAIKLVSTVTLAVVPAGLLLRGAAAATEAGIISFGYGILKDIAKDIAGAADAKVIAFDVTKDLVKEGVSQATDKAGERAATRLTQQTELIATANQQIDALSMQLARKVSNSKIAKLDRQIGRAQQVLQQATKSAALNRGAMFAAKPLIVVFAAQDVWEGIEEYKKDTGH
jgi:hypothetical protein